MTWKRLSAATLLIPITLPLAAFATTYENNNSATIENHTSASTGGQIVNEGESITTGESHAEASVTTIVNGNGEGDATVKVKTEDNGVTHEETKMEHFVNGVSTIIVSTTSANGSASVEARVQVGATTSPPRHGLSAFFSFIFSLFSWW